MMKLKLYNYNYNQAIENHNGYNREDDFNNYERYRKYY